MDDLQAQMNAVLSNPELMEQIKTLVQDITPGDIKEPQAASISDNFPNIDINMLQKLSGIAGQTNIDKNQRSLLSALSPYLSSERIHKLEKAMRASKMAGIATSLLGTAGR